jgi:hypothetical protein
MRRPLAHCLMVLALLFQGVGSAWAATRMSAGEVAFAAHVAELPPCHQVAAKATRDHGFAKGGMNCCGTANCHCVMGCAAAPASALNAQAMGTQREMETAGERVASAPAQQFYGPPLRPPAPLLV